MSRERSETGYGDCKTDFWMQSTSDNACEGGSGDCDDDDEPEMQMVNEGGIFLDSEMEKERRMK